MNKYKRGQYVIFASNTIYYIKGVRKSRISLDKYFYIVDLVGRITDNSFDKFREPYCYNFDRMCRLATPIEVLLYGKTKPKYKTKAKGR